MALLPEHDELHTEPQGELRAVIASTWALIEALLIAFVIITFVVNTVGISGSSMSPTLHDGERAFVPKYETWLHRAGIGSYARGDIVYFRPPAGTPDVSITLPFFDLEYIPFFIKRIVGLPGERVQIDNGRVFVDDVLLEEPYLLIDGFGSYGAGGYGGSFMDELTVPEGQLFVMGDNRLPLGSIDSRRFGTIPIASVAGRAAGVVWPPVRQAEDRTWQFNLRRLR